MCNSEELRTSREIEQKREGAEPAERLSRESAGELSADFNVNEQDIGFGPTPEQQVLSQMDVKMLEFISEKLKDKRQVGFFSIIEGESKENKVKAFQELLSLESKDAITMEQKVPFGDIVITQREPVRSPVEVEVE